MYRKSFVIITVFFWLSKKDINDIYEKKLMPMLYFPLFFYSPFIKCISSTSIFTSFVLCIILCLFRRDRKYCFFPSFPCFLFTLVDTALAPLILLKYLHLSVFLDHFRLLYNKALGVKTAIWVTPSKPVIGYSAQFLCPLKFLLALA